MKGYKKQVGELGEHLAVVFLEKYGYKILDQNYHCRFGELDIVAKKNGEIVFIEVKTRTNDSYGLPHEAITSWKVERLEKSIFHYLLDKNLEDAEYRFDAIEVMVNMKIRRANVRHWKNVEV